MSQPPEKPLPLAVPLNFLLGCSDKDLADYELARLAAASNFRNQLLEILDQWLDATSAAALARWFRTQDRVSLKNAIENPEEAIARIVAQAQAQIRDGQRGAEELIPRTSLEPGAAHLAAGLRYQERNIAEGKCQNCPQPLDRNSVRYCSKHLAAERNRHQKKGKAVPGSREYLYSEEKQPSTHGRQPGTLASLAMNREKASRALCAEAGIPFESAAISLKAAKEALLRVMPDSETKAMSAADLFQAALVPSRYTGDAALRELISAGKIRRIGKGGMGVNIFRYFAADSLDSTKRELASQHAIEDAGRHLRGPR